MPGATPEYQQRSILFDQKLTGGFAEHAGSSGERGVLFECTVPLRNPCYMRPFADRHGVRSESRIAIAIFIFICLYRGYEAGKFTIGNY